MTNPYLELARYVAGGVDDAPTLRAAYRAKYAVGRCAETIWDDGEFTLGFEYGLLALAAILADPKKENPCHLRRNKSATS